MVLSFDLSHCSGFMCLFDGPVLVSSSSSSLPSEDINSKAFSWFRSSLIFLSSCDKVDFQPFLADESISKDQK